MQAQNKESNLKIEKESDFFKEQSGIIKYYLLAGAIFGVLYIAYTYLMLGSDLFEKYLELLASLTSQFVNTAFGEASFVINTELGLKIDIWISGEANVEVGEGCDASIIFALLAATVLAWPSKIGLRILVTILGLALFFALNILRIATTLFAEVYYPLQLELLSVWVLPNLLILLVLIYFYVWTRLSGRHPDEWN